MLTPIPKASERAGFVFFFICLSLYGKQLSTRSDLSVQWATGKVLRFSRGIFCFLFFVFFRSFKCHSAVAEGLHTRYLRSTRI